MSKKDELHRAKRKTALQLLIAALLISLPLVMVYINGKRAVEGLLWGSPESGLLAPEKPDTIAGLQFGVFDPRAAFRNQPGISLEQVYISWADIQDSVLLSTLTLIHARQRTPVLTIEPWEIEGRKATLLTDITSGRYDPIITQIVDILNRFGHPVYISWGHEMDQDLTERYSWSASTPENFIAAYQYFFDKLERGVYKEITWIWAPVVKPGTERYWPGDSCVDMVGIPVYGYPEWEKGFYGRIKSFNDWFNEKYALISRYNKPVIITELGVTGDYGYRSAWLMEAFREIRETPAIRAIIFFNAPDTPGVWGDNVATPDWRIEPALADSLIRGLYQVD